MVKATMHSILNTLRNIFLRLYGSVSKIRDDVSYMKYGGSCVYILPPPLPPPKKKKKKKKHSWIWILCQNSLTKELKVRFVGLVL